MDPAQIAIRASTQDHLEIEDIREGIVLLKNGGACVILSVSAINYDLLSEKEQEAMIYAYAALLNSLTFPIQIVIRTQPKDVSDYINLLKKTGEKETRPLIKNQILKYIQFVEETVKKNNVLDKKFYIVIPMSPLEISGIKTLTQSLKPTSKKLPFDKDYILQKAKINLLPKKDHIIRLLRRLGIKGKQLDTKELIKLFFEIYNPESPGQQVEETEYYTQPMVEATLPQRNFSLEKPTESQNNSPSVTPNSPPQNNVIFSQEEKQNSQVQKTTKPEPIDAVLEKINNLVKNPDLNKNEN
ncbi:MAG: hypothetical protein ACPLKP_02690 [Microgenomates group bacterium]